MWNVKTLTIVVLLTMSTFILSSGLNDSEDNLINLEIKEDNKINYQSNEDNSQVSRAQDRPLKYNIHGGSWFDSFNDDSKIDWSLTQGIMLDKGETIITPPMFNVDSNTLALWHFNEGNGTVIYDESSNDNDGTLGDDGMGTDLPNWTLGKFGSCLSFDGKNDYVTVPCGNGGDFDFEETLFTIELYFKSNTTIDSAFIAADGSYMGYTDQWYVGLDEGKVKFYFTAWTYSHGTCKIVSPLTYNDNKWHHVVAARTDRISGKLYVDGELVGSKSSSISNGSIDIRYDLEFGMRKLHLVYNGSVDEVRISDKVRKPINPIAFLSSETIQLPPGMQWNTLIFNKTQPKDTTLNISMIDPTNNKIINESYIYSQDGEFDISYIDSNKYTSIKLNATFEGRNWCINPILNYWGVSWKKKDCWFDTFFKDLNVESSNNIEFKEESVIFHDNSQLTSKPILIPNNRYWDTFNFNLSESSDLSLNISILNAISNQPIDNFFNIKDKNTDISSINPHAYKSIKLKVICNSGKNKSIILNDWSVNWTENIAPTFVDIKLPSEVYRTKSVQIRINISDLEESEDRLTLNVEYKGPSYVDWYKDYLSFAYFTNDYWNLTFTPPRNAELGEYSFRLTVNDSFQYQNMTIHQNLIEVINNKPTQPDVYIKPVYPKTTDDLEVFAENSTDIDPGGGKLLEGPNYWYRWYHNGTHLSAFDNLTKIPKTETQKYDVWSCMVYPYDGDDFGILGEAEVIIYNSPPKLIEQFTELKMIEDVPIILEDKLFEIFKDADSDILTLTATGQRNLKVEIYQNNGTIRFFPKENWFGKEIITFYANDSFSSAAKETVHIEVMPANDVPKIIQIGNQIISGDKDELVFDVKEDEWSNLTIIVDDIDGDVEHDLIKYSINKSYKSNLYLEKNVLKFKPYNADVGYYSLEIKVTDNNETPPIYVSQIIWFNIENVNDPPTVIIISPEPNEEFLRTDDIRLNCEGEDIDLLIFSSNEKLTYIWYTNNSKIGILGTEKIMELNNHNLTPGHYTITVMVKDVEGKEAYDHVNIVIKEDSNKQQNSESPDITKNNLLWIWISILLIIIIIICIVGIFVIQRKKQKQENLSKHERQLQVPDNMNSGKINPTNITQFSGVNDFNQIDMRNQLKQISFQTIPNKPSIKNDQIHLLITNCPLCQKEIQEYTNPCPHCGGELQWG